MITPPSYPLRPVNGGPLPLAQPKHGLWDFGPKLNGWRAWAHPATRSMWNRENKPLSITAEFKVVLDKLYCAADHLPEWLDVEALSRRVPIGKGSLILLDAVGTPPLDVGCSNVGCLPYDERQQLLYDTCIAKGPGFSWAHEQFEPLENELLSFAYTYRTDDKAPEMHPAAAWVRLQEVNQALGCELFEGLVAKRADSLYPLQLRSPDLEFPFWMKHRWSF
jgi:hypothetical protein